MANIFLNLLEIDKDFKENIIVPKLTNKEIIDFFSSSADERMKALLNANAEWRNSLEEARNNKHLIKNIAAIEDKYVESLYTHGYEMYKKGMFRDAFNIFRFLILIDFSEYRFAFGVARCLESLEHFQLAGKVFRFAAGLDPTNPFPCFCAANCSLEINDIHAALISFEQCIYVAGDNEEHTEIKERALLNYQGILAQIIDDYEKEQKKKINI